MSNKPLVTHIYTADPSAHVFNDVLYVYPSHDRETDIVFNDNGDQYDMTGAFSLSTFIDVIINSRTQITMSSPFPIPPSDQPKTMASS